MSPMSGPKGIGRRKFLASAVATALAPQSALAQSEPISHAPDCPRAPSLAVAAAKAGITFGASIGVDVLDDAPYVDLLLRETGILTTDLAFKLPFIYPAPGRFDFAQADSLLAFSKRHSRPLRAHTLFWDLSNPDWIAKLPAAERRYEFDRIIDTIVARYSGHLHSWDVVNEPFWPGFGEPGGIRRGPWYDAFGKSYVSRAFARVAALDPGARLVLNVDMTEREDDLGRSVRRSLLALVDDLKAEGRRIDAVGLQGHLDPSLPFDPGAFEAFLWQIAARKVAIYITELDVLDTTLPADAARRDVEVADHFGRFLGAVLKVPAVEIIATWQLSDAKSWYRSDWYRSVTPALPKDWQARPLPFGDRLERKASWYAIERALCRRGRAPATGPTINR